MKNRSIIISILILIVFLAIALPADARQVKCDYCGGGIKGEYIHYNGKYYHKSCYEKVAPRCAYCNEIIDGEYVYSDEKTYHRQCYLDHIAIRCAICRELIEGNYIEHEGGKYHEHCYNEYIALHCDICGEPINGPYKIDFWGNKYHTEHDGEYPRCDYCQRLITAATTGGGRKYSDGRNICDICFENVVVSDLKVQSLCREIRSKLDIKGISIDISEVSVNLVDKNELSEKSGDQNPKELGFTFCEEVYLNGETIKQSNSIYILTGLPEIVFKGVLVHEMMHVWFNSNTDHNQSPPLSEGACNYASYIIYTSENGKYAEFLLDNLEKDTDPAYGVGYRKVKNYIKQNGLFAFLKYLKYYKDLP